MGLFSFDYKKKGRNSGTYSSPEYYTEESVRFVAECAYNQSVLEQYMDYKVSLNEGIVDTIASIFEALINFIKSIFEKLFDFIGNLFGGGSGGSSGSSSSSSSGGNSDYYREEKKKIKYILQNLTNSTTVTTIDLTIEPETSIEDDLKKVFTVLNNEINPLMNSIESDSEKLKRKLDENFSNNGKIKHDEIRSSIDEFDAKYGSKGEAMLKFKDLGDKALASLKATHEYHSKLMKSSKEIPGQIIRDILGDASKQFDMINIERKNNIKYVNDCKKLETRLIKSAEGIKAKFKSVNRNNPDGEKEYANMSRHIANTISGFATGTVRLAKDSTLLYVKNLKAGGLVLKVVIRDAYKACHKSSSDDSDND